MIRSSLFFLFFSILIFSCKKDDFSLKYGTDYKVWVASPWQRVLRDTPPGELQEVSLKSAKNEYAPFRIIIYTGDNQLKNVTVKVSDLTGASGKISSENIKLYRAHYLYIHKPSYRTNNPVGWYPDALIPFSDPDESFDPRLNLYYASPFTTGQNVEVWCDLFIPPNTSPGDYTGDVSVIMGKAKLASLPVKIKVWDFQIPEQISMRSRFGSLRSESLTMMGIKSGSDPHISIANLYNKELISHRAVPATPSFAWPSWNETEGIIDNGESERIRKLVNEDKFNALDIPFRYRDDSAKCSKYMADIAQWLKDQGYLDMSYVYLYDEPNNKEEYERVRKEAAIINAGDPDIKRLCTEQTITTNPAWGDLYGSVDIWCPLWTLWDIPTAEQRLQSGEELWSYTALCQGAAGTPWWQIDMEPLNFRAPAWISRKNKITGFLYWSSNYWSAYGTLKGVWEKPYFRNNFWGEGLLLYPGAPAGINGFIPSIRLKLYREAMEDYEYMVLASKLGKQTEADIIVRDVVTNFQSWSNNLSGYELAREKLANLILSVK